MCCTIKSQIFCGHKFAAPWGFSSMFLGISHLCFGFTTWHGPCKPRHRGRPPLAPSRLALQGAFSRSCLELFLVQMRFSEVATFITRHSEGQRLGGFGLSFHGKHSAAKVKDEAEGKQELNFEWFRILRFTARCFLSACCACKISTCSPLGSLGPNRDHGMLVTCSR